MNLERQLYNLLLRRLTGTDKPIDDFRWSTGRSFKWNTVLEEDKYCNAAKFELDGQLQNLNYWINNGWELDELVGGGKETIFGVPNAGYGILMNCNRLKETLKLAQFHSQLIEDNEIVNKIEAIINRVKEVDIWEE